VDKENYYEQKFPKIPYVYKDHVYLFKDDVFGIDLRITNGMVQGVSYQSDTNKAAVSLRFTQEVKDNGDAMMLLVIENHTKHKLFIDALMTVPKREKPQRTSILPVDAGRSGFESWPHPIVQLVLQNIRFTEKPNTEQKD
jgi:acylphosphatase